MLPRIVLLCVAISAVKTCGDFYWRNYEGIIPYDAIPAGKDSSGKLLYVGMGYIHNYGIFYGAIKPMEMDMTLACYGTKKTNLIKILCSKDHRKYYWLPVTSETYKQRTTNTCPVSGGYDKKSANYYKIDDGPLHIGRTLQHGEPIIGQIAHYKEYVQLIDYFYYPYNGEELQVTSDFQVLVYSDFPLALYNPPEKSYVMPVL